MWMDIVQTAAAVATAIGVVSGIYFGVRQLKATTAELHANTAQVEADKRAQQAQFLLAFDQMLDRYNEVHNKLRPGGEWAGVEADLEAEDWTEVERYMGLFERAKILIDDGIMKLEEFDHLYGYRVRNIVANPTIRREKLENRPYGWRYFIELVELLKANRRTG